MGFIVRISKIKKHPLYVLKESNENELNEI